MESDPLIESCDVKLQRGNIIRIEVEEKKIVGYRYDEEPLILFYDNTSTPLKSEYLGVIAEVPLINGFFEEEHGEVAGCGYGFVAEAAA